ncbi:hypothetical protein QF001_000970 [Paraburkholderia youngii]
MDNDEAAKRALERIKAVDLRATPRMATAFERNRRYRAAYTYGARCSGGGSSLNRSALASSGWPPRCLP